LKTKVIKVRIKVVKEKRFMKI